MCLYLRWSNRVTENGVGFDADEAKLHQLPRGGGGQTKLLLGCRVVHVLPGLLQQGFYDPDPGGLVLSLHLRKRRLRLFSRHR